MTEFVPGEMAIVASASYYLWKQEGMFNGRELDLGKLKTGVTVLVVGRSRDNSEQVFVLIGGQLGYVATYSLDALVSK